MASDRFVNKEFVELQVANRSPIYGYQHLPILTLEEATENIISLVPGVKDYVSSAKRNCNRSSTLLTHDESAAIYLYSMPISFFSRLNEALRAEDRHALKPWFTYLKLFINALEKLPSSKGTIWRGVNCDVSSNFIGNGVHIWWSVNSCSTALNVVELYLGTTGTVFAIDTIHGKDIAAFSTLPEEQEIVLMPGTRVHLKCQSLSFESRFFLIHLEEETSQSESQIESNYLFGHIKQEYQRHSRIASIMNPSTSFPIEESYINLAIVETKEQKVKEKKLLDAQLNHQIIGTFEDIYATKTNIEIKDIFQRCNSQTKNILVLGRAGIGKTTFCRYVVYQWATGAIWQHYDIVVFIRLRNLTESRYPPLPLGQYYSPTDVVKKEYFHHGLSEKDDKLLKEQFDKSQVLWLLDGYDEIVQNIPDHLKYLFEQLLNTPNHIVTSRPYSNTLSYKVQLEITGFTNDNIKKYVEQFFDRIKDEIDHASIEAQELLTFLECNPKVWGIVHIPLNLELICSLWCDNDWSETTTMAITTVYDKMIEWLCRRHLEKQNVSSIQMTKADVYRYCHKELAFLESLAFHGMETNSVILRPKLLRIASKESECSLQQQPHLLNIGILKSLDYKPIGTQIEADKNHYFVHLSFQEHFAARYLIRALGGDENQKKKATDFIQAHKYNQRFEFVFSFASGLLNDSDDQQHLNSFWEIILGEPLDIIGFRHVQLVISCIEETGCNRSLPRFSQSLEAVIKWIKYFISKRCIDRNNTLSISLPKSPSLVNQPEILDVFSKLLKHEDSCFDNDVYWFISTLPILNYHFNLIHLHLTPLSDDNAAVRTSACKILDTIGEKVATNEIINQLVSALGDTDDWIRSTTCKALSKIGEKAAANGIINQLISALEDRNAAVRSGACEILGKIGEKAPSNEIINRLVSALGDADGIVTWSACDALCKMREKAATNEIIDRLAIALEDRNDRVRSGACRALGKMGEKAATNETMNGFLSALEDRNADVRISACDALGQIGEKAATIEIINRLVSALGDTDDDVRRSAYKALGQMGEKAATNEIIDRLVSALGDRNSDVRSSACKALGRIGEKAATKEIINRLVSALGNRNTDFRSSACNALGRIGEKAATSEIINRLVSALEDTHVRVRSSACYALGQMGEKAATTEVINRLVIALEDRNADVRRNACDALGQMGEKAATTEVINRLMSALGDTEIWIGGRAFEALSKMGEKAATIELIEALIQLYYSDDAGESVCDFPEITRKILEVCSCLSHLKHDSVRKLSQLISVLDCWYLNYISPEKFVRAFLETEISFWLPIIKTIFVINGYGITLTENTVTVYCHKEPVELRSSKRELGQQLHDYLVNEIEVILKM